tara:strand:+ start:172 stop:294 length:123 start_codon:yes stop_codon:yes gene_type:complete
MDNQKSKENKKTQLNKIWVILITAVGVLYGCGLFWLLWHN